MPPLKAKLPKLKSMADLGKLFGIEPVVETPKVETRKINPYEIYRLHENGVVQNNLFFETPYYQLRFSKVMSPEEAAIYKQRIMNAATPGQSLEIILPGTLPESNAKVAGLLNSDEYKNASRKIDEILMKATDPMNMYTMPLDKLSIKALDYNDAIFKNAELAPGLNVTFTPKLKADIRAQVLEDAKFNRDYNEMAPQGYLKLFTKKGWNALKYYLLGIPSAIAITDATYSEQDDPVLQHMLATSMYNGGRLKRRIRWEMN